jgi:L-arabinokinase
VLLHYYVSGHGFGHASRSAEVMKAILERAPAARIVVRTSAPRWFIESAVGRRVVVEAMVTDTGVIQSDSLGMDTAATALAARAFYDGVRPRSDPGPAPSVVVGDIPPIAFEAAHSAGIPSVAVANFTWDWIYAGLADFERLAPGVVDRIRESYGHATAALRLPFSGGFESMGGVTQDIPLVARHAGRARPDTRRLLSLDGHRPVVLASFGGHGLNLPYRAIAERGRFTLIVTDHETTGVEDAGTRQAASPAGRAHVDGAAECPTYVAVTYAQLAALGLKYEDLVAAADVVVSKPGYGIVSECIANGAALLYAQRAPFPEQDVLVREMPRFLRCREIQKDDLLSGRWSDALDALLQQPPPPERMRTDGASVAAEKILTACHPS